VDSRGNQCALFTDYFTSCHLDWIGEIPDWEKCPMNNPENRERIERVKSRSRVYPEEFGKNGILLADWIDYIMNKKD